MTPDLTDDQANLSDPAVVKPTLRRQARLARDAMPADLRAAASAAIAARVDAEILAGLPAGATIALYAPIATEVTTDDLARRAAARGFALAYPRVAAGTRELTFFRADPAALRPGTFGIPEPDAGAQVVPVAALAAVILPGLAFDRRGARLGWGRGHYDATLADAPAALRVGLAFEMQLADRLPVGPDDQLVHVIITEAATHPTGVRPFPGL